jgi:hypothetical protein
MTVYALWSVSPVIMVLMALALIQIKHQIIDWMWQPPFEYLNKGTYGHWGGVRHALKNAIGTGLAIYIGFLGLVSPGLALSLAVLDFVIHYHIDWSKVNLNRFMGWGPTTHAQFWWLTGFDQTLHQLTYLGLIYLALVL